MVQLTQGDALEVLSALPGESVDLVVTDPAYASLEKHRKVGTTTRLKKKWFPVVSNDYLALVVAELYRVLKKNAHCYIMCDQETLFFLKPVCEQAGFTFWKFIVWDKARIGMGYHYRAQHECILFLEKGKRKLRDLGVPDVITSKAPRGGYPTQKPVDVLEVLVLQSSEEGDMVLDPFMGSGSTGDAALSCGRDFIGIDIQEDAMQVARERLGRLME